VSFAPSHEDVGVVVLTLSVEDLGVSALTPYERGMSSRSIPVTTLMVEQ